MQNWDGQIHAEPDWTSEPQGIRSLQMESTLPGTQAADTNKDRKSQGALGSLRKTAYRRQDNSGRLAPLVPLTSSPYHLGSPQHFYMAKHNLSDEMHREHRMRWY